VFASLILSKLLYAIPAFAGQLSADDINRYDALSRKAVKRVLITDGFSINNLIDFQDGQLFSQMLNDCHCLHHLLPPKSYTRYNLRKRGHQYSLPDVNFKMFKNSFVNRCLFSLDEYSLLTSLLLCPRPRRGGGGIRRSSASVRPSVCPSVCLMSRTSALTRKPKGI